MVAKNRNLNDKNYLSRLHVARNFRGNKIESDSRLSHRRSIFLICGERLRKTLFLPCAMIERFPRLFLSPTGPESLTLRMKMNSTIALQRAPSTVAPSDAGDNTCLETESICNKIPTVASEVSFDIRPFSAEARSDPRISHMVQQVHRIGEAAFWGNNCLIDCSSRRGWRLNIIAQPAEVGNEVFGFLVYKIDSIRKVLHIQYIAVDENYRRQGIGSRLIKSIQKYSRETLTRSSIERIVCSCLPDAVEFYQRHQFRKGKRIVADYEEISGTVMPDGSLESQIPLQFHMEWKVPKKKL